MVEALSPVNSSSADLIEDLNGLELGGDEVRQPWYHRIGQLPGVSRLIATSIELGSALKGMAWQQWLGIKLIAEHDAVTALKDTGEQYLAGVMLATESVSERVRHHPCFIGALLVAESEPVYPYVVYARLKGKQVEAAWTGVKAVRQGYQADKEEVASLSLSERLARKGDIAATVAVAGIGALRLPSMALLLFMNELREQGLPIAELVGIVPPILHGRGWCWGEFYVMDRGASNFPRTSDAINENFPTNRLDVLTGTKSNAQEIMPIKGNGEGFWKNQAQQAGLQIRQLPEQLRCFSLIQGGPGIVSFVVAAHAQKQSPEARVKLRDKLATADVVGMTIFGTLLTNLELAAGDDSSVVHITNAITGDKLLLVAVSFGAVPTVKTLYGYISRGVSLARRLSNDLVDYFGLGKALRAIEASADSTTE